MKRFFLAAFVLSVMVSCNGTEHDNHTKSIDSANADGELSKENDGGKISEMADFKFHTMIANLPSPLETFQIISNVDLDMSGVQLTPTSVASGLATVSARAYGYGVFMTDMGFMAYEKQNQQTLDYFQVSRELASKLGAGEVFDRTISQNFEENTSDEEQFVRMMDDAFKAMDDYMVNNERFVNATEIFVGSWVESQIIATQILLGKERNETNLPVYEGIYAQKQHASNLINVLGEIDTEISTEVYTAVEDLMLFYAGFSTVENISQEDLKELAQKLNTLKSELLG